MLSYLFQRMWSYATEYLQLYPRPYNHYSYRTASNYGSVLSSSHHRLPTACSLAEVPCGGDVSFLLRKIQVRFRELLYTVRGSFQPHHLPLSLLKASTSNHDQISLGIPVYNHQATFGSLYKTAVSFSFPDPIVQNHNFHV